jgi:hypothetical protein
MLELRLDGVFLFRFAERRLPAELFQLPPRLTRFVPLRPDTAKKASAQFFGIGALRMPNETVGRTQKIIF